MCKAGTARTFCGTSLVAISTMRGLDLTKVHVVGAVFMEGLAPVAVSFAILGVAWFLVAIGDEKISCG
jgi:hypothetical protein